MKFFKILFVIVIFMIGFMIGSLSSKKPAAQGKKEAPKVSASAVKVQQITKQDFTAKLNISGKVESKEETTVFAETSGKIVKINFKIGDMVTRDDVIIEIDDEYAKKNYASVLAAFESAKVNFRNAESDFKRNKKLYASKNISQSEYEKAEFSWENAQSGFQASKAQLELAKSKLDAAIIKADFNGVISEMNLQKYQNISNGSELFTLTGMDEYFIYTGVAEENILNIEKDAPVKIKLTNNVVIDAKITGIGRKLTKTFQYPVQIDFTYFGNDILPGMIADIEVSYKNYSDLILVPVDAVQKRINKNVIFIAKDNKIAEERAVTLGRKLGNYYEILDGLKENEILVTEGAEGLYDNAQISIIKEL